MTQNDQSDTEFVDQMLAEAGRDRFDPPAALSARVLAQARALQPGLTPVRRAPVGRFLDSFGGWQAVGGLLAASCVGFWIGISPPAGIVDPGALLLGVDVIHFDETAEMSAFGWDPQEG